MAIYYSSLSSLLFLLLLTDWTDTASLRFSSYPFENHLNVSMINNEYLNYESIDAQLPLLKRLKRWMINGDHDEVEIPLGESLPTVNHSNENSLLNSIDNSTLMYFEIIESNVSIIEHSNDLNNGTNVLQINLSTLDTQSNENTTILYPLLRQDLTESKQTIISTIEDVSQNQNTTFSPSNSEVVVKNVNQIVVDDKNESITNRTDEFEVSSIPISLNQTEPVTTIIDFNHTIVFDYTTVASPTYARDLPLNDKIETSSSAIAMTNESIIDSNVSQKETIVSFDQELLTNDTGLLLNDTAQNSNESAVISSKALAIPICDFSCLCSKECLYGFEIQNDTCLCHPPCENYPCFGTDTCIITDEGHPSCQPENGTEHDRPTRCYQPRDAGYHDLDVRYHNRWYYHPDQDTCHLFVYRGLGGNENNFQTLHECHSECITCGPLPDPGECLARINMWYYDNKKSECREFAYSGCKGNENKFLKKEQCIDTCINRIANSK